LFAWFTNVSSRITPRAKAPKDRNPGQRKRIEGRQKTKKDSLEPPKAVLKNPPG
jgi:hypothetical protein